MSIVHSQQLSFHKENTIGSGTTILGALWGLMEDHGQRSFDLTILHTRACLFAWQSYLKHLFAAEPEDTDA